MAIASWLQGHKSSVMQKINYINWALLDKASFESSRVYCSLQTKLKNEEFTDSVGDGGVCSLSIHR